MDVIAGRYELRGLLGTGTQGHPLGTGFGPAYLARDLRLDVPVVVKRYALDVSWEEMNISGDQVRASALRAAEGLYQRDLPRILDTSRRLEKPFRSHSLASVCDFVDHGNSCDIVMDYVEGTSLRDLAARGGGLMSLDALFGLLGPVFDALGALRERGLVHGDVRPENILVDGNDQARLVGFEFPGRSRRSTVFIPQFDTPYRTMPDVLVDPDVYGLSAILYEMTCGQAPPRASQRASRPLPSATQRGAVLSPACEEVLVRGLSIDPLKAYKSPDELLRALEAAGAGEPQAHVPNVRRRPGGEGLAGGSLQEAGWSDTGRCAWCMSRTDGLDPCPVCGRSAGEYEWDGVSLRPGTILNGLYQVGAMAEVRRSEIAYVGRGLSKPDDERVLIREYFNTGVCRREASGNVTNRWPGRFDFDGFKQQFFGRGRMLAQSRDEAGAVPPCDVFEELGTVYVVTGVGAESFEGIREAMTKHVADSHRTCQDASAQHVRAMHGSPDKDGPDGNDFDGRAGRCSTLMRMTASDWEGRRMETGDDGGFESAAQVALRTLGTGVLGKPTRFVGAVVDLYDPDSPEAMVLYTHCSNEFLRPFAEAAAVGTEDALEQAAKRAELWLHDVRRVDADDAHDVAWAIARALGKADCAGYGERLKPLSLKPSARFTNPWTKKSETLPELLVVLVFDASEGMRGAPIERLNHAMDDVTDALRMYGDSFAIKIAVLVYGTSCPYKGQSGDCWWIQPRGPEPLEDFFWEDLDVGERPVWVTPSRS